MTVAYLNPGSTTLVDAAWSDGDGFSTANAELVIQNNTSTITAGLDQTGNPIDYLHVRGGGPRMSSLLSLEFRETSTVAPALVWNAGGSASIALVGTYGVDDMLIGGGANLTFVSGTLDGYCTIQSGTVVFAAGFVFGAGSQLIVNGGAVTIETSSGSNVLPLITHNGGSVTSRRGITTITQNGGTVTYESATNPTTRNANGGTFRPIQNAGATVNQGRGITDTSAIQRAQTITTLNVFGGTPPADNALLTVTTTNLFGQDYAQPAQAGAPLT